MWRIISKKYRRLLSAIALFILLDIGVLTLNVYTSYQIADDAHAIQIASRQGALLQQIFTETYNFERKLLATSEIPESGNLADAFRKFDEVFDAFVYGGELIGVGLGQDELLQDDTYSNLSQETLLKAYDIWMPLRPRLGPLVYADYYAKDGIESMIPRTEIALSIIENSGGELGELVSKFAVAVEQNALKKAQRLRYIQLTGILLALINFIYILYHFSRDLTVTDARADSAARQTREILDTVDEGLMLIGPDFIIGEQQSYRLQEMIAQGDIAGRGLLEVLGGVVSEDTLNLAEDYLELLFDDRVAEHLIEDLNPLSEVQMLASLDDVSMPSSFIRFRFKRVYVGRKIEHLLVTMLDVTEQVNLRKLVEELKAERARSVEMSIKYSNIDRRQFNRFKSSFNRAANEINEHLKSADSRTGIRKLVANIGRVLHGVKGDASALTLELIVDAVHLLEDELLNALNKSGGGENLLAFATGLNELIKIVNDIDDQIPQACDDENDEQDQIKSTIATTVDSLSEEYGFTIELDTQDFTLDPAYIDDAETLGTVLNQLVINAVVHGLVPYRSTSGQDVRSVIKVRSDYNEDGFSVSVEDNGQGIQFDAVRDKIKTQRNLSPEDADLLSPKALLGAMFESGVSTHHSIDKRAGRGIGLSMVRVKVRSLGGRVSVASKLGEFTRMTLRFEKLTEEAAV